MFRGAGGPGAGFRAGRVGAVCESIVARAARPRVGEGREGSGQTGETRALGGFPGSPGALQFPCPAGAARYSRPVLCTFPGHLRGGVRRCFRGEAGGVWGTRNRGRVLPGPGAVPGSPVRFWIGLPCCLFTRVVEM